MNKPTISDHRFYRTPADREKFFERVMKGAGRPPFVRPHFLSRRPRAQQRIEIIVPPVRVSDLEILDNE